MKNHLFAKFILIFCIIQVVLVTMSQFADLWLDLVVIVVTNIALYQLGKRFMERQQISTQELMRQSAQLAQDNSRYLSDKSPSLIFIFNDFNQVEWMNQNALSLLHKYGKDTWHVYLLDTIKNNKVNQGLIRLPDDVLRYSIDRKKNIAFFYNVTDQMKAVAKQIEIQPAVGLISIDNYDDVIDKMGEKEISYLNSFVTTFISDWAKEYQIYYKRLDSERFFFVAHAVDIKKMEVDKFSIVERLKKAAEKQSMYLTISIGISFGDQNLKKIGEVAQNNLDIALLRGGDQVVLKEAKAEAKPKFFGGNTAGTAKRTRVRSRAMSTALNKLFTESKDIYIMGHRFPDMDAIGAAYGVACLADFNNRRSFVVINEHELIADVERGLAEIYQHPELEGKIISPDQAMRQLTKESLLIMVDYHRPSLSISQELYEKFERVAIIDHHRRGEEFPSKPLLTYIESSASSAAELVSELIQYESNSDQKLDKMTATLLLAGMTVDTKNFSVRTSSRTFDVASYLKNNGADSAVIQYMLSSDLASFLAISELVARSEFFKEDVVVACASDEKILDSVTTAKTADTLLSMSGIEASFVITRRKEDVVGISARSSGHVNVQTIMERLGGGGHFTNAATQIRDKDVLEIKEQLFQELTRIFSEKEGN
ncbi:MAG: DHH family phosphoesterase [Enterococcus sp.]